MKAIGLIFMICIFTFPSEIQAQNKRICLFNDFMKGTVLMRNKAIVSSVFNYDAAGKVFLYKEKEEIMILTNTQAIDTVFVSDRKFIPIGRIFLEVIPIKNDFIYIDWKLKNSYKGKVGAYGQTTQANVTVINTNHYNNQTYEKQTADVFTPENKNEYFLFRDGKPVKFKNKKSLLKLFPGKESVIEDYIKEAKIDMSTPSDVINLMDYCLGL